MFSIFSRDRDNISKAQGSYLATDMDDCPSSDPDTASGGGQAGAAPETSFHTGAEELLSLLSVITANAEFLGVIFGENEYLKNILQAAVAAQQRLQEPKASDGKRIIPSSDLS